MAKRKIKRKPKSRRTIKAKKKKSNGHLKTIPEPRYVLNTSFEFLRELRELVLKSSPAERDNMVRRIAKIGNVKLAVVSGIFMNRENLDPTIADLLIVGDDIERYKLNNFLRALEAEVGKEIKYAVMEKEDFQYRLNMFDRFVWVILESPHDKLINKLGV